MQPKTAQLRGWPVLRDGSVIMNNRAEIEQAQTDYAAGRI